MTIITVTNLKKRGLFACLRRFVYAVNDVSFSIGKNETYSLVGESACGKTTIELFYLSPEPFLLRGA